MGSNIGDRKAYLRDAAAQIIQQIGGIYASRVHETDPVGFVDQPKFLNAVVMTQTELSPEEVMKRLLAIEKQLGRDRAATVPKGPRTIDLDLLLYDDRVIDVPGLTVPHPAMHERRFVLEPLVEIAPNVVHPVLKRTAREILQALKTAETPTNPR